MKLPTTLKLVTYKHSSSWRTFSSRQPELRFPEASLETKLVFVPARASGSNTCSAWRSFWETRARSSNQSGWIVPLLGCFPPLPLLCTQCSGRSLPRSPGSLMCHHFFFCTSCSSFRAAVFFGSTLSRLFRSSTQALMSCRNHNESLELKTEPGRRVPTVHLQADVGIAGASTSL